MKISDIILIILAVISVIVGLWYLFGASPTLEQTLLIFILTAVFSLTINVSRIGMKVNLIEQKVNKLENSFVRLADDFKSHIKYKRN